MLKYIKKLLCFLIVTFLFINTKALELDIHSENAILFNENDNQILYEKNPDKKSQIASLTKIMTALITLENVNDLDQKVTIISQDLQGLAEENLVTAGFKAGETLTYRDLLYGLLLPSGADSAKALARLVGQTETNFVTLMNKKVQELKLKNTHFDNPIGLDSLDNYSTATEMATIFKEALKNADFKKIISTKTYKTSNGKHTLKSSIVQRDGMDYLIGGKTGTTDGAGLCLASIAKADGQEFLLVTLNAPYDKMGPHNFEDAKTIYSYFIDNYELQTILSPNDKILSLDTKYVKQDTMDFYPEKAIKAYVPAGFTKDELDLKYRGINLITAKMQKGQKLGDVFIYYQGNLIDTLPITLTDKPSFSLTKYLLDHKVIILCLLIILVILGLLIKRHQNKQKSPKKRR